MLHDRRPQFWRWPILVLLCAMTMTATAADAPVVGKPAADFALKTLTGSNLRLSEFLGQVVVLNFWATWAGSSRQEMPVLEKLHTTYGSAGLVLLGISVDEDQRRATDFVRALNISYPILFDARKSVAPLYALQKMPTTILIDRAGVIRYVHVGYPTGADKAYVAELRTLLDE